MSDWRVIYNVVRRTSKGPEEVLLVPSDIAGCETETEAREVIQMLSDADRHLKQTHTYEILPLAKHKHYGLDLMAEEMGDVEEHEEPPPPKAQHN
jgi:hypothetical protein